MVNPVKAKSGQRSKLERKLFPCMDSSLLHIAVVAQICEKIDVKKSRKNVNNKKVPYLSDKTSTLTSFLKTLTSVSSAPLEGKNCMSQNCQ